MEYQVADVAQLCRDGAESNVDIGRSRFSKRCRLAAVLGAS